MKKPNLFGHLQPRDLFWLFTLLLPALLINLGLLPLGGDESIRALVSLEMMIRNEFITPTLNGELYYNKPPLYNWLLILFFKIFNNSSEFICRLPTVIALIIYGYTIFYWVKKQFGRQFGILSAVLFLTCGRILFRDSFLGLIDITYSWILFLNFMLIWHFFEKKKFMQLFLISYFLTAVTFLMKGIPSLVFQAITLFVLFVSTGNFRKLISWKHISGILLLLFVLSSYYVTYYLKNPDAFVTLLSRLISESTDKSALGTEIFKTIVHFINFPFVLLYHFAPWTILFLFLCSRPVFKRVIKNSFIRYCSLVFAANIVVYWLSPTTYPRYLLMLFPLLFIVFLYTAKFHAFNNTRLAKFMSWFFLIALLILLVANALAPAIFNSHLPVDHVYLKSIIILAAGALSAYSIYLYSKKRNLIFALAIILLISRISFNLFLFPYRQSIMWPTVCRQDALNLAWNTQGKELYLMTDTITIPNAYYLTRERNELLKFENTIRFDCYYIVADTILAGRNFKPLFPMRIPMQYKTYYGGEFISDPE